MNTDRDILRELAKKYADLAADKRNAERRQRAKSANSLICGRPVVWLHELPWHEMDIDGELVCRCEGENARQMETFFRRSLYRWKYIQADMVLEDAYYIEKSFSDTGLGVQVKEDTISKGDGNNIISHSYHDQLNTQEKLELLRDPVITAHPEEDRVNVEFAGSILDGILPVRLRGHGMYHAPWDAIGRLRGVEAILIDIIDRPEFTHAMRRRFMEMGLAQYEQMESLGLLDFNVETLHCTPSYVDELPREDKVDGIVRLKHIWFRGMAQIFDSVSPDMHEEFDLQYMRPLMDKCGLSYYGCCEALDTKIDLLKKIPNMRKIGVSPWANVEACAEQIGSDYVVARKPNPALVTGNFDEEAVRKETVETVEACMKYHCPYELVLKDISSASNKPQNLIQWVETVEKTLDEYYL